MQEIRGRRAHWPCRKHAIRKQLNRNRMCYKANDDVLCFVIADNQQQDGQEK